MIQHPFFPFTYEYTSTDRGLLVFHEVGFEANRLPVDWKSDSHREVKVDYVNCVVINPENGCGTKFAYFQKPEMTDYDMLCRIIKKDNISKVRPQMSERQCAYYCYVGDIKFLFNEKDNVVEYFVPNEINPLTGKPRHYFG